MSKAKQVQEIVDLVRQIRRALYRDKPDAWTDLDLTVPQLKTLFFIDSRGTTNTKTIAEKLGVTPSNITGIIDRLVKQGLVSRKENPADRRMFELRVTQKGENTIARLRESSFRSLFDVLGQMGEEDLAALARGFSLLLHAAETEKNRYP